MTDDERIMLMRLQDAARDLLDAADRTVFYDNSLALVHEPNFGEGDDDMGVDGGDTPFTIGHLRRLKAALDASG